MVYAAIVALAGSVLLFGTALRREAATMLSTGPDIVVQAMVLGRQDTIDGADLEALKGLRGVRRSRRGCGAISTTRRAPPTTP